MSKRDLKFNNRDVASMSAARSSDPNAPPTHKRDGIHLISASPTAWEDLTGKYQFSDVTYRVSVVDKGTQNRKLKFPLYFPYYQTCRDEGFLRLEITI